MGFSWNVKDHHRSCEVKVGNAVIVESWVGHNRTYLKPSEVPELGGFRVQSANHTDVAYLANISITGRKVMSVGGECRVRISIEFVNEDEENTVVGGWMVV